MIGAIDIPEGARRIIRRLEQHGFEGYIVGGCVRDAVLGRMPSDWDITTSALPEQVKALFSRTVDTGIEHGTVTVLLGDAQYEVTTYRIDGTYEDARHPDYVTYTSNLALDLRRRDFTINAMAWSERTGLVDLFGGRRDLEQRVIRCVGRAEERFAEDALRIMRAVRFSAQLGFVIEEETARAAGLLSENLRRVSAERIFSELTALLVSKHPDRMETARLLGITKVILPEFDALFACPLTKQKRRGAIVQPGMRQLQDTVGEHTLRALCAVEPDRELRLAALLHEIGRVEGTFVHEIEGADTGLPASAPASQDGGRPVPGYAAAGSRMAEGILRRLRCDRAGMDRVCRLIRFHAQLPEADEPCVRRFAHELGPELVEDWIRLRRADLSSYLPEERPDDLKPEGAESERPDCLRRLDEVEEAWKAIRERKDPLALKDLAVGGRDLIGAGMKPGKELGAVLEALLFAVLEDPARNTREWLLRPENLVAVNKGIDYNK